MEHAALFTVQRALFDRLLQVTYGSEPPLDRLLQVTGGSEPPLDRLLQVTGGSEPPLTLSWSSELGKCDGALREKFTLFELTPFRTPINTCLELSSTLS